MTSISGDNIYGTVSDSDDPGFWTVANDGVEWLSEDALFLRVCPCMSFTCIPCEHPVFFIWERSA